MPAKTHGHLKGYKKSPTYLSWISIKARCYNKKHQAYKNYGAKGVVMCERWKNSFEAFLEDMGERPEGHVCSRKGDKGNYEPGNCEWKLSEINRSEGKQGERNHNTKLTEKDVLEIRDIFNKKELKPSMRSVAKEFNVNHQTISRIVNRKAWAHI